MADVPSGDRVGVADQSGRNGRAGGPAPRTIAGSWPARADHASAGWRDGGRASVRAPRRRTARCPVQGRNDLRRRRSPATVANSSSQSFSAPTSASRRLAGPLVQFDGCANEYASTDEHFARSTAASSRKPRAPGAHLGAWSGPGAPRVDESVPGPWQHLQLQLVHGSEMGEQPALAHPGALGEQPTDRPAKPLRDATCKASSRIAVLVTSPLRTEGE